MDELCPLDVGPWAGGLAQLMLVPVLRLALRETRQLNLDKISFTALKFKRQIWALKRSTDVYKFPSIGLG